MDLTSDSHLAIVNGVVAVLPRDGRLLVIQRAAHILAGGAWCLPGGGVEPGETQGEAVIRELDEEIGLAVRPIRKLWECSLHDGRLILHWWLVELAGANGYALQLNPDEVADARWLAPDEIRELPDLLESNRTFLAEVADQLQQALS